MITYLILLNLRFFKSAPSPIMMRSTNGEPS